MLNVAKATGPQIEIKWVLPVGEAILRNMLNISSFSFRLIIQQMFDNGSIYNLEVLDMMKAFIT